MKKKVFKKVLAGMSFSRQVYEDRITVDAYTLHKTIHYYMYTLFYDINPICRTQGPVHHSLPYHNPLDNPYSRRMILGDRYDHIIWVHSRISSFCHMKRTTSAIFWNTMCTSPTSNVMSFITITLNA